MKILDIANIVLFIASVVLIAPCFIFFIECLAAWFARKPQTQIDSFTRPKTTILIPAHNEAAQIKEVLKNLLSQITPQDRIVVIADNCHDNTAELARATGVTVIERKNLTERGKGYALDYGMKFIQDEPPEVVVILDGDCITKSDTIEKIARKAIATGRPVQATYLMDQPEDTSLTDRMSMFALKVKNLVRLLGLNRLGWHSLLTGSGMAFPWSIIKDISLAGSKTTDDMQLTVDLAIAGYTPVFCEEAVVVGRLMKDRDAQSQRSRWEHGHLEMILVEVPRLLKEFSKKGKDTSPEASSGACMVRRLALLALALDIFIPPLSLLVMIWFATMAIAWMAVLGGISLVPAVVVTIAGVLLFTGVFLAWNKFGRSDLSWQNLMVIPFYILGKIPIYLKFLIQPQSRWLKTERDSIN